MRYYSDNMHIAIAFFALLASIFAFATEEVVTPRVRVLYEHDEMAEYAQLVAAEAEEALDVLVPLFKFQPRTITIIIDEDSDIYNGRALSLPHLKVQIRPLFPIEAKLGLRAQSNIYHLLIHELTHAVQTTYTLSEPSQELVKAPESGFLNPGGVASLAPAWFLEGIAVWAESNFTEGGRNGDALTIGTLDTLALADGIPSLTEVGLANYSSWPAGDARYLLGGAFTEHLINSYGFETILATLQNYNKGGIIRFKDFSTAWEKSHGSSLEEQWQAWQGELKARAETRNQDAFEGEVITNTGWYTGSPAISPNGKKLAWVSWPHIVVAEIDKEGNLGEVKRIIDERVPSKLDWLDEDRLVYTKIISSVEGAFSELFSVKVSTGSEEQLTPTGTRVFSPTVTSEGCVLLISDDILEGSNLLKWCDGNLTSVWQAPKGIHILNTAVSKRGRIALSLWQNGFTDIALLNLAKNELRYINQDYFQDLEPAWLSENTLVFRSDRHTDNDEPTAFDLYQLALNTNTLTRLTRSLGGAFQPEASNVGIWYSSMTGKGTNIALLKDTLSEEISIEFTNFPSIAPKEEFPVQSYNPFPSLTPYAVVPSHLSFEADEVKFSSIDFSVGATLLAEDLTETHRYNVNAGYGNFYEGHLNGVFAYATYAYTPDPSVLGAFKGSRFSVQLGLWPHNDHRRSYTDIIEIIQNNDVQTALKALNIEETALGAKGSFEFYIPLDRWVGYGRLSAGLVHLESINEFRFDGRAGFLISQQRSDTWGYATRGLRLTANGIWSARFLQPSYGAWGTASYYQSLGFLDLPGVLELYTQGGYNPTQPIPISINSDFNGLASLGYRYSQPVEWRYGDGLYALERLTFTPRLRSWVDQDVNVGGDLTLGLDTMINYMGAVTFSGTFGYAEGFWYRLGVGLSF